MLTILDELPEALLHVEPRQVADVLSGPSLIHLKETTVQIGSIVSVRCERQPKQPE